MNTMLEIFRASRRHVLTAVEALPLMSFIRPTLGESTSTAPSTQPGRLQAVQPADTPDAQVVTLHSPQCLVFGDQPHLFAFGSDERLYHAFEDESRWSVWQAVNDPEVPANTIVLPTVLQVGSSIMVFWCADNGNVNICRRPYRQDGLFKDVGFTIGSFSSFGSAVCAIYLDPKLFIFATSEHGECAWCEFDFSNDHGDWSFFEADWSAVGPPTAAVTWVGIDVLWTSDCGRSYQIRFDPGD